MDVNDGRLIDDVIILGSGESILDLTEDEINYINNCKTVIAMNKFMAFYKQPGIIPTHVYFHDTHEKSLLFLKYIFKVCREDHLTGLTFILSKEYRAHFHKNKIFFYYSYIKKLSMYAMVLFKNILKKWFFPCKIAYALENKMEILLPRNQSFQFVATTDWLSGETWATTLDESLFHFRGSLTSVLNFVSITNPGKDVYLVGNDFYGKHYFFEKGLQKLSFEWRDWTTPLVEEQGVHFSFQSHEGTKMSDKFPEIVQHMHATRNNLFCTNDKSLLVVENFIPHATLPCRA